MRIKIGSAVIMCAVLIAGIAFFQQNAALYRASTSVIRNFKSYYLKSYISAAAFKLKQKDLASLFFSIQSETPAAHAQGTASSIPVLLYHGVIAEADGTNVTLDNFRDQMFALHRAGYRAITMQEFDDFMIGKATLPERSFLLTFDDGRKDSYYPVDPILDALGYHATMFVITGFSLVDSDEYYLTTAELARMLSSGRWDIESHSRSSHKLVPIDQEGNRALMLSNKMWLPEAKRLETDEEFRNRVIEDLTNAKRDLEETFRIPIRAFAYPYGDFGQQQTNHPGAKEVLLEEAARLYRYSFYQSGAIPGYQANYPGRDAPYTRRIDVRPEWTAADLMQVIENSGDKAIPFRDDMRRDHGWIKMWGEIEYRPGALIVAADSESTGGGAILDGTYLWRDYTFSSRVRLDAGESVSLYARYQNADNYLACTYSDGRVILESRIGGKNSNLAESKIPLQMTGMERSYSAKVLKDKIECRVDGATAIDHYYLPSSLRHGGIGYKTWGPVLGQSRVTVLSISVQ